MVPKMNTSKLFEFPVASLRQIPARKAWPLTGILLWLLAPAADARDAEGRLANLQTPNNGMPALVLPGGTFEATLKSRSELRLSGAQGAYPVDAEWTEGPGGVWHAQCRVPTEAAPGAYALLARTGEAVDTNSRAVYLFQSFPDYYAIAHLSDTHLGKTPESEAMNLRVMQEVNASGAAIAVVTGDLTEGGEPAQFQAVLRVLDTGVLPTFVCPGNHDREAQNYEQYFGPLCYSFRFGQDGYLVYDTKDFFVADSLGPQDGQLEMYRRALKPARWTIGLTHRYEASQGLRSQLTLFVDTPLDFLLFGHWHRENTAEERIVPWGTTVCSVVPAAVRGSYRVLDMTVKGLLPRPVQKAHP